MISSIRQQAQKQSQAAKIEQQYYYDDQDQAHGEDNNLAEDMAIMNSDFFNDDLYDYKETFFNQAAKNELAQDEEYALEDDDDDDQPTIRLGNDHRADFNLNSYSPNQNQDDAQQRDLGAAREYFENNDDDDFAHQENENENEQDLVMMDTFFKRVDSMEFVKPKKAKIINNYLIGEMLGDGSYGKVKECLDMESLARRAVKIINLKMVARKIPKGVDNVRKEIKIMKKLNHKNLIKLYSTFEKGSLNPSSKLPKTTNQVVVGNGSGDHLDSQEQQDDTSLLKSTAQMINNLEKPPKLYIFMDYCITSLEKLLKNAPSQRIANFQANYYFKQLMEGLEYLHSLNIIHNDIKPGNLLITCDDLLKICDFSISADLGLFCEHEYIRNKKIEQEKESFDEDYDGINPNLLVSSSGSNRFPIQQCTPMFQCPEMLDETIDELLIIQNAPKIDIWSSGITLYQLTTGSLPFQGQTIHQIFELIRNDSVKIQIPDFIDKNLKHLLNGMLLRDLTKRWSIKQIRDCEWFKKKHPIVKEEFAQLPQDIVQNELGTFRMLNYLEKYCQDKIETNNNISNPADFDAQNYNFDTLKHNSTNSGTGAENFYTAEGDFNENLNRVKQSESSTPTNHQVPAQAQAQSPPAKPKFAAKVKRNHCSLM